MYLVRVTPPINFTFSDDSIFQACHNFFVKKPKIFENVKSERGSQFSEKPDSARVNYNFQKFSNLRHKNMFAGSVITMNMIQHYFCLILMNQKLANF